MHDSGTADCRKCVNIIAILERFPYADFISKYLAFSAVPVQKTEIRLQKGTLQQL